MALQLLRITGRQTLLYRNTPLLTKCLPITTNPKAVNEMKAYWEKNEVRLNRPMSPITNYRFPLTSVLSIMFRVTGVGWTFGMYGVAYWSLASSHKFTDVMNVVREAQIAAPILYGVKAIIAWPLIYHSLNGIRHLAWDSGYGFKIKDVYRSGWSVLYASLALTALAIAL